MLRNYLSIAWRNLRNSRGQAAINIIGLTTGTAMALLISLWVWDEWSFDHYHTEYRRLARVMDIRSFNGEVTTSPAIAIPLGDALRRQYGDVLAHTALVFPNYRHSLRVEGGSAGVPGIHGEGSPADPSNGEARGTGVPDIRAGGRAAGDQKLIGASGIWAEPDFPEMFSLRMVAGDRTVLRDPSSVLIDQSLARALFGAVDPVGQMIRMDNSVLVRVGGVYEDLPKNTSFYQTQLILPWDRALVVMPWAKDLTGTWDSRYWQLYVELKQPGDMDGASARIRGVAQAHVKEGREELRLQPMKEWHLYNDYENGKQAGGRIRLVRLTGGIGAIILLLACINFMNLSTARSARRAREVGIRKAIGGLRRQLIGQFLGESLLVTALSFVLAVILAQCVLHGFNQLTEKDIRIPWLNGWFWTAMGMAALVTGLLAGSYPAFYLSGFRPVKVLKGNVSVGRWAALPRKVLMVVQFTASIALIIGTLMVYRQIKYARQRPVGYNREGLVSVAMNTREIYKASFRSMQQDLLRTGDVLSVSQTSVYGNEVPEKSNDYSWRGKDPQVAALMSCIAVTHDFGRTIGWQVRQGRDFSSAFATDTGAIILNAAAARLTGFANPVGESIRFSDADHRIIGVVDDLMMESPYSMPVPMIYWLDYHGGNTVLLRLRPDALPGEALRRIEKAYKVYNPGVFEYHFATEEYGRKFAAEEQTGRLALVFTGLALLISCLGLFGLASFVAEQRTREVGIRKVLGASVVQLWQLLCREFLLLVGISALLAIPAAWLIVGHWLQGYAYRTSWTGWVFLIAGGAALLVALLTVSYRILQVALFSPVRSLRTE